MKIGICTDHDGYALKQIIHEFLNKMDYDVLDFGAFEHDNDDDYPDFVIPLARAIAATDVRRGIAICGSGVGASITANKVTGVRAALIHDHFSAHQGVEDDDMNLLCPGGRVIGFASTEEMVVAFSSAEFSGEERHRRRLQKLNN